MTPFTKFRDGSQSKDAQGHHLSDSYTRLIISSQRDSFGNDSGNGSEPYQYIPRDPVARFFVGKENALSFSAKVSAGQFEATVPLVAIEHVSNSQGEQWNRFVLHHARNFPLFLVPSTGQVIPSASLVLKGTNKYQSQAAARGVQIALNVARAVAPEASVITTLTQQATKNKAEAIDKVVSDLYGTGITETHWSDLDLRQWREGQGADITLMMPLGEGNWEGSAGLLGTWTITFDLPRPSIFVDWFICAEGKRCSDSREKALKEVYSTVQADTVLGFRLFNRNAENQTLGQWLGQRGWFSTALVDLGAAGADGGASTFCRAIRAEISELGLNSVDAGIVVWATYKAMPSLKGAALERMRNSADCAASITPIENEKSPAK